LRSAGIDGLFDAVIETQSHTGAGTAPAVEDYLMAVEAMGVSAEETAVFEDTPGGLESARAAHLGYIVAVDRPPGHDGELRHSGADVVIDDLSSLAEAHHEAR
jgi:beta-phosphoglucomutase-like phosphatase (HAD superfamily)